MINFDKLNKEYLELSHQLSQQETLKDREKYAKLTKRFSYLERIISYLKEKERYLKEKEHLSHLLSDSHEDREMKELAQEEAKQLEEKLKTITLKIEDMVFEDEQPQRDVIIEIRSAAGGNESALFSGVLFKMYTKYAENNNWKVEILSSHPTEIGGFKEVIFSVKGKGAYSHLKFESGVHRVQRVPVTEASGRIHTSTTTVAVLVEPKEVEIKINPEDLKIDTFRSSGAGGQHVNVTDSAVRITHLPTGTIVSCQDERSQIKNREKALRVIKARLMEKKLREETAKMVKTRRTQVGGGERSEKIRTYNFPERRVTDHRINLTIYRLEEVLEGDLDEITAELIKKEREEVYEAKGLV
ncbi:MAG: peptide chain release factor 1 [Candidatus Omnitrophica bacterium]|jgi:peptide chain release factor 1|nr:peptide chain release factor 1 [Candidatus Omnitrophota bacterium]